MKIIPQWTVAIFIYCVITTVIVLLKPALMFCPEGNIKKFGVGIMDGNSIFSATIVFPVLGILCYIWASLFKLALV